MDDTEITMLIDELRDDIWGERLRESMREVAREEVASLAGMMLRRLQEEGPTRSPERNMAVEMLSRLWGEALNDFTHGNTPGD